MRRLPRTKKTHSGHLSGEYIQQKRNVIFIGNSGTGKSHLSIALGEEAINQGYTVKYYTVPPAYRMN
ncbi:ATP-binding protein [Heyndrickxia sporothermodurans]|uniref:ATP-binding protein n=1 Tax=Heyndrickxia sporothermodurans TaxID=46224 RepID=UPI0036D35813